MHCLVFTRNFCDVFKSVFVFFVALFSLDFCDFFNFFFALCIVSFSLEFLV